MVNAIAAAFILVFTAQQPSPPPEPYTLGPDSQVQAGVPKGRIEGPFLYRSKVFAGTIRHYWVYVPAQYNAASPASVMVFQDGHKYVDLSGRVPRPGRVRQPDPQEGDAGDDRHLRQPGTFRRDRTRRTSGAATTAASSTTRSATATRASSSTRCCPRSARSTTLTTDPDQRAIAGASSGGICAFTVAWERPDAFRKVLSHIGSFTNIRGGHVYPALIRKSDRKPIRVFLQDGSNDLDNPHGNWPLANQEMAAALKFKGYDYKFEFGDGAHTHKHGGAILPDSLRWLWRAEPSTEACAAVHAGPRFAGPGRRAARRGHQAHAGPARSIPGTTRDYWVYVPKQYDAGEARGGDGVPGRRRVRPRGRQLARAGGLRQPDSQRRHAGHDRRLRQPRRRAAGPRRRAPPLQPQLRIRRRGRPLRAVPDRRDPAGGGQDLQPHAPTPISARSAAPVPAPSPHSRRPGTGPTPSAASSAPSAPTSACAAGINSAAGPQVRAQAAPHLPAGRHDRPEQLRRQLVSGQPGAALVLRLGRLRRRVQLGHRRAQQPARRRDSARGAAVAVARRAGADRGGPAVAAARR